MWDQLNGEAAANICYKTEQDGVMCNCLNKANKTSQGNSKSEIVPVSGSQYLPTWSKECLTQ